MSVTVLVHRPLLLLICEARSVTAAVLCLLTWLVSLTRRAAILHLNVLCNRNSVTGSLIGGVKATQEIVDLCAAKGILPTVTVVPCSQIDAVFAELQKGSNTVQRYVLDMATMGDFHEQRKAKAVVEA